MNKLDFSALRIHGRHKELSILRDAYQRASDAECASPEIVLLHGYSGTGKSALIEELKTWAEQTHCGEVSYFASGKFSQHGRSKPYSALAEALDKLCDQIMASNDTEKVTNSFTESVGTKAKVLLNIIPNLAKIIGRVGSDVSSYSAKGETTATSLNQLKFVFRALLRSVCAAAIHPVVIVLDDLHWSDTSSLELIDSMLSDSKTRNLLLIGAYRDNEVNQDDSFIRHLRDVESKKTVVKILISNLSAQSVNELVSDVTGLKTSETESLADVVYNRTNGNPFFVLQFLRMLEDEKLLWFSLKTFEWKWDAAKIISATSLTDNVVSLVTLKIQRLPFKTGIALRAASCVWSTFDVDLLRELMIFCRDNYLQLGRSCGNMFAEDDNVGDLLDVAVGEGLLDKLDEKRYKFSHDHIQQIVYSLIPSGGQDQEVFHYWIGERLRQLTESPRRKEWMYFASVDQLNRGSSCIKKENRRVDLAKLNLLVGIKSIELSAFVPAAAFLQSGIDLLPSDTQWTNQYDLCLKLHTKLCEVKNCIGDIEVVRQVADAVISNGRCFEDKVNVYYVLCESRLSVGDEKGFHKICHHILLHLGEPLPKRDNRAVMLLEYSKLRRMLRGMSDKDLITLPMMKNDREKNVMRFCYLAHHGTLRQTSFAAMKSMEVTLRYGLCMLSAMAFANFGGILVARGDIQEGFRFGKLALQLSETLRDDVARASVTGIVYVYLNHWMEPLQQGLDPIMHSHTVGMINGHTTEAFQCILAYQACYFYSGLPLQPAAEDLLAFSSQMLEYKQNMIRRFQLPVLQTMLNLMGRSKDVLKLTGEVMDQEFFEDSKTNPEEHNLQAIASCRLQLAYYFGDMELASEMTQKLEKTSKSEVYAASYLVCVRKLFLCLVNVAVARRTKKRKYAAKARKIIMEVEHGWVQHGAVNCVHKLQIMKAEYASIKNRDADTVKEAYDISISSSRRAGFIQDEALANERAGLFFLERNDNFWASSYLSRACELYGEWGAQAKVDHMERLHGTLLSQQEQHSFASHLRGRARFKESHASHHKSLPANKLFDTDDSHV